MKNIVEHAMNIAFQKAKRLSEMGLQFNGKKVAVEAPAARGKTLTVHMVNGSHTILVVNPTTTCLKVQPDVQCICCAHTACIGCR